MKIGIDFDDVLLDSNASLARFHNAKYGTSCTRNDFRSWDLKETWGCSKDEVVRRVMEWFNSPEHVATAPVHGAQDAIALLSRHHELHIVTARAVDAQEATAELLAKNFVGEKFSGIHFASTAKTGAGSKVEICQRLGVAFMIEDAPHHAHELATNGTPVLLFDTPWNQQETPVGVTRVFTWEDVLEFVEKYPCT